MIFATWFTYNLDGKGWWLVMTAPNTGGNTFAGTLLQVSGPPFDAVPFDTAQVTGNAMGTGTLTFTDSDNGSFSYTVKGISQTKAITREVFDRFRCAPSACNPILALATNYQDLWWNARRLGRAGESTCPRGDTLVATWFTYDHDRSMWLVATAKRSMTGSYAGTLYRTTGPPFNAMPFKPAAVVGPR